MHIKLLDVVILDTEGIAALEDPAPGSPDVTSGDLVNVIGPVLFHEAP